MRDSIEIVKAFDNFDKLPNKRNLNNSKKYFSY